MESTLSKTQSKMILNAMGFLVSVSNNICHITLHCLSLSLPWFIWDEIWWKLISIKKIGSGLIRERDIRIQFCYLWSGTKSIQSLHFWLGWMKLTITPSWHASICKTHSLVIKLRSIYSFTSWISSNSHTLKIRKYVFLR